MRRNPLEKITGMINPQSIIKPKAKEKNSMNKIKAIKLNLELN